MFRNVCPAFVFLCLLAAGLAADESGRRTASLELRGVVAPHADIQVLTPRSGNVVTPQKPASQQLSTPTGALDHRSSASSIATITATTNSRTGCSLSVSGRSGAKNPGCLIVNGEHTDFEKGTIHLATLRRADDGTGDFVSVTLDGTNLNGETLWLDIVVP